MRIFVSVSVAGSWVTDVSLCVMQIHSVPHQPADLRSVLRRGVSPRRSSYALSQGAGPGSLIASGIGIRSSAPAAAATTAGCHGSESGIQNPHVGQP